MVPLLKAQIFSGTIVTEAVGEMKQVEILLPVWGFWSAAFIPVINLLCKHLTIQLRVQQFVGCPFFIISAIAISDSLLCLNKGVRLEIIFCFLR